MYRCKAASGGAHMVAGGDVGHAHICPGYRPSHLLSACAHALAVLFLVRAQRFPGPTATAAPLMCGAGTPLLFPGLPRCRLSSRVQTALRRRPGFLLLS